MISAAEMKSDLRSRFESRRHELVGELPSSDEIDMTIELAVRRMLGEVRKFSPVLSKSKRWLITSDQFGATIQRAK